MRFVDRREHHVLYAGVGVDVVHGVSGCFVVAEVDRSVVVWEAAVDVAGLGGVGGWGGHGACWWSLCFLQGRLVGRLLEVD